MPVGPRPVSQRRKHPRAWPGIGRCRVKEIDFDRACCEVDLGLDPGISFMVRRIERLVRELRKVVPFDQRDLLEPWVNDVHLRIVDEAKASEATGHQHCVDVRGGQR